MIFSSFKKRIPFYIMMLLFVNYGFSQKKNKVQLELKRIQIQKEIKLINELLFSNKKKKKAVYNDIESLSFKIQRKEELVKLTNQQINLLENEIKQNVKRVNDLNINLSDVKEAYKDMILKSYKTKSGKSILIVGGNINKEYLDEIAPKIEKKIKRKVNFFVSSKQLKNNSLIVFEA